MIPGGISHPWESEQGYALICPDGVQIIPGTLKLKGPTISAPNLTMDKPPGAPAGKEFPLGDGQRTLLPIVFEGPVVFSTEAEKALYVAQMNYSAATAEQLERAEMSGPLGKDGTAPGFAEWTPGDKAVIGTLKITLYQTARPQINGQEVDWA